MFPVEHLPTPVTRGTNRSGRINRVRSKAARPVLPPISPALAFVSGYTWNGPYRGAVYVTRVTSILAYVVLVEDFLQFCWLCFIFLPLPLLSQLLKFL